MIETISKEQFLKAYQNAPDIVQAVFDAELTTQIIVGLEDKFQLHIDVAGLLGREVGYMLLGLVNPQEFLNELITAGIPDKDAREIITEINQKIFMPLREEMRKGLGAEVKSPQAQSAAPSAAPRPMISAQQRPPQTFTRAPKYVPPRPAVAFDGERPPPALREGSQTSPNSGKELLEDHEEPHIEFTKATAPPLARTAPPPPNLPGVINHPPLQRPISEVQPSPIIPKVESQIQPKSSPPKPVTSAPIKSYSSDPYREPIDEK